MCVVYTKASLQSQQLQIADRQYTQPYSVLPKDNNWLVAIGLFADTEDSWEACLTKFKSL